VAAVRFLHLLGLAVWIGSLVFFSFVTAPSLFGALPRELAGRATAAIFPRYYLVGAGSGLVALAGALLIWLRGGGRERPLLAEAILLVLMLALTLYAWQGILPEADRLRGLLHTAQDTPEGAAAARFGRLHRRSVSLNGAVLLLGLGALVAESLRGRGGAP
jgi:uncharacterized membrane protein